MAMVTTLDPKALAKGYSIYRRNASMTQVKLGDKLFNDLRKAGFPYVTAMQVSHEILSQETPSL